MDPLVSVIIPVYKVEKYLRRCVDSVLGQTYQALEVILVDDGSPDGCPAICDAYAASDHRVRVIHKENGGLSDARNAALAIFQGHYLMFIDSDDWISPDTVESFVDAIDRTNADIVVAGYQSFRESDDSVCGSVQYPDSVMSQLDAMRFFSIQDWGAWGKLYKRYIHIDIPFPTGRIHEDESIMFQLLDRCRSVCTLSTQYYHYLKRDGSITASSYSIKKMDWFYGWNNNVTFLENNHPECLPYAVSKAWNVALYNLDNLVGQEENTPYIKDIQKFLSAYRWRILLNPHVGASQKVRLLLASISRLNRPNCFYIRFYRRLKRL